METVIDNRMLSKDCVRRFPGLDDVPDMMSFKDPRSVGPRRLETWIVLELCGLGSLQVCGPMGWQTGHTRTGYS